MKEVTANTGHAGGMLLWIQYYMPTITSSNMDKQRLHKLNPTKNLPSRTQGHGKHTQTLHRK